MPEGYLIKRGAYYNQRVGKTEKGITRNPRLIRSLARKAFLMNRLQILQWNLSIAENPALRPKAEDFESIINGLPSVYRDLPLNYFYHPSVNDWNDKESLSNAGHSDELQYMTDSGILVRSKSELTIANILEKNKIPYRYENPIGLGRLVRYPDFTIKRPHDGEIILWEHFGLMDKDDYQEKAIEKITLYAQNKFYPFSNIIYTYEQDIRNRGRIQELINTFIKK